MADPTPAPVAGPPAVPGYDTGLTSSSGLTTGTTNGPSVSGDPLQVGSYTLSLVNGIKATDRVQIGLQQGNTSGGPQYDTVGNVLQKFATWTDTQMQKFRLQAYQAGLITSKNASKAEILVAYQTVVEEAVKDKMDPGTLIQKADDAGGWNNIQASINPSDNGLSGSGNANNAPDSSTTNTSTVYTSYLDPATIQGAQADAWFRLLGRNPTPQEYQDFLKTVYAYQDEQNTGKFQTTDKSTTGSADTTGGTSNSTTNNIVAQREVGQRGLQYLAGQSAMANPEEGNFQADTTYFNAFMKALSGPAAGMQSSGPTNTAP